MEEVETIGQRLRRLRLERGLSQRELAEPGVSYAYISRIEANTRRVSVKAIRKLAVKLRVDPYYLEFGTPNPERERMWAVLEVAKFWRARSRFLERRLAEFEKRMTADPTLLGQDVLGEVVRLRLMVEGEESAETEVAQRE